MCRLVNCSGAELEIRQGSGNFFGGHEIMNKHDGTSTFRRLINTELMD